MCNTQDVAPPLCVSAVNTLLWVGADRPYRLQLLRWCDSTYWPVACWPLSSAANHFIFCSSSPLENRLETQANQNRESYFAKCQSTLKDNPLRDARKASPVLLCNEKGRHTVFHINFSSAPHFSSLGIDFKMRTPVAASLFSWPTKTFFFIAFHCSLT